MGTHAQQLICLHRYFPQIASVPCFSHLLLPLHQHRICDKWEKQSQGVYRDLCKWAFYLGATQGVGSLACPAGLVAGVALPQWHRCPPKFWRSCTRKACKTLRLAAEVHSPSSNGCNAIREPCSWKAVFSRPAHPDLPTLFPQGCLTARSFGPWLSQRLGGRSAERCLGDRVPPAWRAPNSSQLPSSSTSPRLPTWPTPGRGQLLLFLSAVTSPSHTYTPASPLQAKQPQFNWYFLISCTFPVPPTVLFALFSAKNWSQKSRADLPTVERSRQLLVLSAGYLPTEKWCLPAFLFKTMQFLPHIQLVTVIQPIFYQTVFLEWDVYSEVIPVNPWQLIHLAFF